MSEIADDDLNDRMDDLSTLIISAALNATALKFPEKPGRAQCFVAYMAALGAVIQMARMADDEATLTETLRRMLASHDARAATSLQ